MFQDSSFFVVPNTADKGRDNLPGDAAHATEIIHHQSKHQTT